VDACLEKQYASQEEKKLKAKYDAEGDKRIEYIKKKVASSRNLVSQATEELSPSKMQRPSIVTEEVME